VEINGIAHIFITARDFDRCRKFYGELLPYLGLTCVADVPGSVYYCVGGRTGFGVQSPSAKADARFVQGMPGLHHVCFRARERTDIDSAHEYLRISSRRVTIRCCSKIRTGFGSRSITYRVSGFSSRERRSARPTAVETGPGRVGN
jgi:catechol-2,3-dioxygenase